MYHIGEQIRRARKDLDLKQEELGARCKPKISQQRISMVERSEINPDKKNCTKNSQGPWHNHRRITVVWLRPAQRATKRRQGCQYYRTRQQLRISGRNDS
jgi:transcriptional regulator with XRE-family HTH domain